MSSHNPAQSPKTIIVTAVLTAVTSLGISFIGIVPQLRQGDSSKISTLEGTLTSVRNQLNDLLTGNNSAEPNWIISGTIVKESNKTPVKAADVYLIPSTGNDLMVTTDDTGGFVFDKVVPRSYWLVMRDPNKDGSSRLLIPIKREEDGSDKLKDKVASNGTTLTYGIAKK